MKTVVMLRACPGAPVSNLPAALRESPWAAQASRIAVHLAVPAPAEAGRQPLPPAYDAVIEAWSDAPLDMAGDAALAGLGTLEVFSSREVIGKAEGLAPVGATPGLSQLTFIRAIEGMPRSEAERHWDEHIPLAREIHVGMDRYVQDRLSPAGPGTSPWFGMAHLHFPDEVSLREGLFRTAEDIAVITEDVAEFVCDHITILATEHVVKAEL